MNETNTYKRLKNNSRTNVPDKLIIHHGGGTDLEPLLDTSNHTAQTMEAWHLAKGWDGLGYQYVIHKNGDIWRGRPEHIQGAHALGQNSVSIGICLSGNFDATLPTKEQENALIKLITEIRGRYPVIGDKIFPHRKYAVKSCFGRKLSDTWALDLMKQKPTLNKDTILKKVEELKTLIIEL